MKKGKIWGFFILIFLLVSTLTYTVYAVLTASLTFSNTISFNPTDVNFVANCEVYYEGYETEILATRTLSKSGIVSNDDTGWSLSIPGPFSLTSTKNVIIYKITIHNYSDYAITAELDIPALTQEYEGKLTREGSELVTVSAKSGTVIQNDCLYLTTTFINSTSSFRFDNNFSISINQAT